jgi:hypothetical protein
MRRIVLFVAVAALGCLAAQGSALAASSGQKVCAGGPGSTLSLPNAMGHCAPHKKTLKLASQAELSGVLKRNATLKKEVATLNGELSALQATLTGVSRATALGGRPTLEISGENVQLESGAGSEDAPPNGLGNLIIGYNNDAQTQTGSDNLVLGTGQTYTSYGDLIAGELNTVSAPFADAFASDNTAGGAASSVSGGNDNTASATGSSVSGGEANVASASESSVSGGADNTASALTSSVSGGLRNAATDDEGSVSGGCSNLTGIGSNPFALANCGSHLGVDANSVSGGANNTASGVADAILGGTPNIVSSSCATFPSTGESC